MRRLIALRIIYRFLIKIFIITFNNFLNRLCSNVIYSSMLFFSFFVIRVILFSIKNNYVFYYFIIVSRKLSYKFFRINLTFLIIVIFLTRSINVYMFLKYKFLSLCFITTISKIIDLSSYNELKKSKLTTFYLLLSLILSLFILLFFCDFEKFDKFKKLSFCE